MNISENNYQKPLVMYLTILELEQLLPFVEENEPKKSTYTLTSYKRQK